MATKRIKDISTTATTFAADDFIALDASSVGTRKMAKASLITQVGANYLEKADNLSDVSNAATSRANLSVNSIAEDAEANGTKLLGPSVYFDGSNDYIEVADDAKLSFTDGTDDLPFSLSCWAKISQTTNNRFIAKFGNGGASTQEYFLFSNGSGYFAFQVASSGGDAAYITSDADLTNYVGKWTHFAVSYNGAGPNSSNGFAAAMNGAKLFINGEEVASTQSNNASYSGMVDTAQGVWVGRATSVFHKGHIRSASIFNRELTAAEVADLAKGNELGYSDQWAGSLGAVYTSDFSAGVDGWIGAGATVAGNIDSIGPGGDLRNDNLRSTMSATAGTHRARLLNQTTSGKRYRVTFDYYIPSSNTFTDGFGFHDGNVFTDSAQTRTLDAWARFTDEFVADGDDISFYWSDSTNTSYTGSGTDVCYIRNVKVTEIGTLADFRSENFDTETGVLTDISSNSFRGVNNGATLVGEDMPLHAVTRTQLSQNIGTKLLGPSVYFDGSNDFVTVADDNKLTFSSSAEFGTNSSGTWSPDNNSPALTDGTGTLNQHYRIDSGAGTVAQGGSTLSVINGTATTAGQAVYYDGSVWRLKDVDDLPFTLSAWVKCEDWSTNAHVLTKYGSSSPSREYLFGGDVSGNLRLIVLDAAGIDSFVTSDASLTGYNGQYIHVAASYSGAGPSAASGNAFSSAMSGAKLFVNGVEVASTATNDPAYAGMSDSSQAVWVGRASGVYITGHIRNVSIYNKELSASEIADLAKGNELGFADEFGGAFGGVYTSNFAADSTDSWTANQGAVDATTTVGGEADNIQYTINTSASSSHYVTRTVSGVTAGKLHRVEFDVYIPSSQSHIDGIACTLGGAFFGNTTPTPATWQRVSVETVPASTAFRIYATDGGSTNITDPGGDDTFAIRNVTITQLGTLADFRSERFDSSTNKWYDLSDNAFVGTNSGATLVGREVPVFETGSWTPTFIGSSVSDFTYSAQEGYYTRVGNQVTVNGLITVNALGTSSGSISIGGLPFTTRNTTGQTYSPSIGFASAMTGLTSPLTGLFADGDTDIDLYDWGATGVASITEANLTATTSIRFSGTYQIQ